jgi:hypothetical protein
LRASWLTILLGAALLVAAPALGSTLPAQLQEHLQSDVERTERVLEERRSELARAAQAQQRVLAARVRSAGRSAALHAAAGMVGVALPPRLERELGEIDARASAAVEQADQQLQAATQGAASAQGAAADADRRLRAVQRAAATEDERDAKLGSWQFGSGGPAVSAASLDRYLASKGSPLTGQGAAFLQSGLEHRVDPRLVIAIAGAEGYFGVSTCAPFNAWGWGCPSRPFAFRSWAHAIDMITLGLRDGYLDAGLTSVGQIHLRYAPPNAANDPTGLNFAWADNVARFLVEQGGDPQQVDGVRQRSR